MAFGVAFVAFFFLAIYFASVAAVGYVIFSPFKSIAERATKTKANYQLTDVLAIFFPVQLGFGALKVNFPDIRWSPAKTTWILIMLFVVAAIAWFYGMRILWRMDIVDWRKRMALLGIVMPIGFVVSALALLVVASPESAFDLALKFCIVAGLTLLLRFLSLWICANETGQTAVRDNA